jgi:hypothetical protein
MRIALITLAVAALAFIGSIIWIFAEKNGIDILPNTGTTTVKISNETAAIEILRSQWKTEDRIKELEAKIDALGGKTAVAPQTPILENTGTTDAIKPISGITATGTNIIPISAKFLTKIITKVSLTLTKNNGIYGLYIFDTNTEYSTYTDTKYGIIVIASRTPYTTWKQNFQAIDKSLFTVNESRTFPFVSFYLNPPKDDGQVRVVMQVESQTLLISIPKAKFSEFKTMMTKK